MVWQVAVNAWFPGQGIVARVLDSLVDQVSERISDGTGRSRVAWLETTITADNEASVALFKVFARRSVGTAERTTLLVDKRFPDDHDTEHLFRIGPLRCIAPVLSATCAPGQARPGPEEPDSIPSAGHALGVRGEQASPNVERLS